MCRTQFSAAARQKALRTEEKPPSPTSEGSIFHRRQNENKRISCSPLRRRLTKHFFTRKTPPPSSSSSERKESDIKMKFSMFGRGIGWKRMYYDLTMRRRNVSGLNRRRYCAPAPEFTSADTLAYKNWNVLHGMEHIHSSTSLYSSLMLSQY